SGMTVHPWGRSLVTKAGALIRDAPTKLRRYPLITARGSGIKLKRPETDFYVLNLYRWDDPDSQRDQQVLQNVLTTDSIFSSFPIVSVNTGGSQALWRLYVRDMDFSWPHFWSDLDEDRSLPARLFFPTEPTYLLLNKQNRIEGYYNDLDKLFAAIRWRMKDQ
ncbi:MAG: hypothetical protein AAGA62_10680, partial [Bacteroidota bacterium]